MYTNPAAQAMYTTGVDNLRKGVDVNTKRMAGAAVVAALLPGLMSMADNQEEGLLGEALSGAITLGGIGGGTYVGHALSQLSDEDKARLIAEEISNLKQESKQVMKTEGPVEANRRLAEGKHRVLNNYEPIDSNRSRQELFTKATGANILGMSPRAVNRTVRGALIGGLASVPLAYASLRGGEIQE